MACWEQQRMPVSARYTLPRARTLITKRGPSVRTNERQREENSVLQVDMSTFSCLCGQLPTAALSPPHSLVSWLAYALGMAI